MRPARLSRFKDSTGAVRQGQLEPGHKTAVLVREEANGDLSLTAEKVAVITLLPPIPTPPAIFCVGLNYVEHAKEGKMDVPEHPVIFMKNPASMIGHGEAIVMPAVAREPPQLDYEGELALVIGRPCKNVSEEKALDYVLGYTVANDVSARHWQLDKAHSGTQWCRGKSFDTFCPLGAELVLAPFNVQDLSITTTVNEEKRQEARTSQMIFSVPKLIVFLSQDTTLLPGTLILTGTPPGVGFARKPPTFLQPGDTVTVSIEGIGTLTNTAVAA